MHFLGRVGPRLRGGSVGHRWRDGRGRICGVDGDVDGQVEQRLSRLILHKVERYLRLRRR